MTEQSLCADSAAGDLNATELDVPPKKVVYSSMKITCIRTHHLRDHLDVPFGFSQWFYGTRNTLWVEIVAEDGTTGWGECYGPPRFIRPPLTAFTHLGCSVRTLFRPTCCGI
jgi:hypothetical protein